MRVILTLLSFISSSILFSQISILSNGVNYTENFNTLVNTGSSSTLPTGWYLLETNTNANTSYSSGTGSANAGDTYSFGLVSNTDRTLGGLQSGALIPMYGCKITNNTGEIIESVTVSYTGKTWRVGTINRSDKIDFSYSLNATSLSNGVWTDFDNLDYQNTPQSVIGGGSILHSQSISSIISGLSLSNGQSIWFRFSDFNASGSDDGLGIDNFVINTLAFVPLPVELIYFNVEQYDEKINILTWSTGSEVNSDYFLIERSIDGNFWNEIGKVGASGNSNQMIKYSLTDNNFDNCLNYYRMKQYDLNGLSTLYGPISMSNITNEKKIKNIIDLSGKNVSIDNPGIIFIIYEDGSILKKYN